MKQAIALDITLVRPRMDLADLYATALRRPADAVQLLHGTGETVGAQLVADARTAGVCFTGSTAVPG